MWRFCMLVYVTIQVNHSVLSGQILDKFIGDDIQYEIEPPKDIRVQCNNNEILVNVDTVNDIFNGIIYPSGLSKNSSCMAEFNNNLSPVQYHLPLRSCNTMSSQLDDGAIEYFNTIVVQPHRKLVTDKGRGFHVRCTYQPKEDYDSYHSLTKLKQQSSVFSSKMPMVAMRIYNADSNNAVVADNAKIGDSLIIMISLNHTENDYGLYVTDCLVKDGVGWSEVGLIDKYGCPTDPDIMGPLKYNGNLSSAVAHFQAFKFPHTSSIYYQCSVHLCVRRKGNCKHGPPKCDFNRRTRRHDGAKESIDDGSEAVIEVYSGLHINEIIIDGKPEQISQVSEKTLNDAYNICISQRGFAVGIAIAGLFLMLLTAFVILCILTRRKIRRRDVSTTDSSIYSGPYTNIAYSHTS